MWTCDSMIKVPLSAARCDGHIILRRRDRRRERSGRERIESSGDPGLHDTLGEPHRQCSPLFLLWAQMLPWAAVHNAHMRNQPRWRERGTARGRGYRDKLRERKGERGELIIWWGRGICQAALCSVGVEMRREGFSLAEFFLPKQRK